MSGWIFVRAKSIYRFRPITQRREKPMSSAIYVLTVHTYEYNTQSLYIAKLDVFSYRLHDESSRKLNLLQYLLQPSILSWKFLNYCCFNFEQSNGISSNLPVQRLLKSISIFCKETFVFKINYTRDARKNWNRRNTIRVGGIRRVVALLTKNSYQ